MSTPQDFARSQFENLSDAQLVALITAHYARNGTSTPTPRIARAIAELNNRVNHS